MGKILQYLGISEEGQNRDILDAERLLEGMQMIYSQSPDGSKKDSFSVPLAEMTKIFIEKVKGIEPTPIPEPEVEEELPFKVGDKFVKTYDNTDIFTIEEINVDENEVTTSYIDKVDGKINIFYSLTLVKEKFANGEWVLVKDEEFPYKVDDKFKVEDTYIRFIIVQINQNNLDIAFYTQDENIDGVSNISKEEFLENVSFGRYIKITDEEQPKPQKPKRTRKPKEETEQDKQIREILEINLDDIDL